jgi:hypothetical protein
MDWKLNGLDAEFILKTIALAITFVLIIMQRWGDFLG